MKQNDDKRILPNGRDIDELLRFLPIIDSPDFSPVDQWEGGTELDNGTFMFPYPEYNDIINQLYDVVTQECWSDHDYAKFDVATMYENRKFIENASLCDISSMLTYFVRGEKFCSGHMGEMIKTGKLSSVLKRLALIRQGG